MAEESEKYDVAIVGAGPAGSAAAIRLAESGLKVVVVEQKKFPREKLCGEFISPECLVHFAELGVSAEIAAAGGTNLKETVFFARNGKCVSVQSAWFGNAESLALGLSRAEMDLRLMERARAVGVDVREDTSCSGAVTQNEVVVGIKLKSKDGSGSEVPAKITIDATGRTRRLARRFERGDEVRSPARFVAFKTHLRGATITAGACEIYVYRGGYGGCNRVEKDLYNLCFIASAEDTKRLGSDGERVMREVVFTNKRASETMKDAKVVKPWLAVPIERFGRGELVPAAGLITVGDAAAFIDPFTGSGMLLALESGKIAAAAIAEGFSSGAGFNSIVQNYRQNYATAFDRRLRVCSLLRSAAFAPFLAESIISLLSHSTNIRRRLAQATRHKGGGSEKVKKGE